MTHVQDALTLIAGVAERRGLNAAEHLRAEAVDMRLDAVGCVLAGLCAVVRRDWVRKKRTQIGECLGHLS